MVLKPSGVWVSLGLQDTSNIIIRSFSVSLSSKELRANSASFNCSKASTNIGSSKQLISVPKLSDELGPECVFSNQANARNCWNGKKKKIGNVCASQWKCQLLRDSWLYGRMVTSILQATTPPCLFLELVWTCVCVWECVCAWFGPVRAGTQCDGCATAESAPYGLEAEASWKTVRAGNWGG